MRRGSVKQRWQRIQRNNPDMGLHVKLSIKLNSQAL
jgi:hypothetical protein